MCVLNDFIFPCHAPQGHGSRNITLCVILYDMNVMPRRGMGVEIHHVATKGKRIGKSHAPQGHGSRNC